MNNRLRTAVLIGAMSAAGVLAPAAHADPVDVEVTSTHVCLISVSDGCDVPADVPAATVAAAGTCVGVLTVCEP
jgi:hypothetical protein